MQTRGERNKNPGNLKDVGIPWRGLIGRDKDGFAIFATVIDGIRAMTIDLRTGFRRDDEDTVTEIITEYAPSEDANDTAAYIAAVSRALNVGPDEVFSEARLPELVRAIIHHENGRVSYPDIVINEGILKAYA